MVRGGNKLVGNYIPPSSLKTNVVCRSPNPAEVAAVIEIIYGTKPSAQKNCNSDYTYSNVFLFLNRPKSVIAYFLSVTFALSTTAAPLLTVIK